MANSLRPLARSLLALALALLPLAATPALAQSEPGRRQSPSVTVDMSVLDSLGPAPTIPDLLRGRQAPQTALAPTREPHLATTSRRHAPRHHRVATARHHKPSRMAKPAVAAVAPSAPPPATAAATPAPSKAAPNPAASATPEPAPLPSASGALDLPTTPPPTPAPTPATPAAAATAPPPQTAAAAPAEPTPTAPPEKPQPTPPKPTIVPQGFTPTPVPRPSLPAALPSAQASPEAQTTSGTVPNLPPAQTTVAAVPPEPAPPVPIGSSARVLFPADTTDLPAGAKSDLDALAQKLSGNDRARLQLVAFASGGSDDSTRARRVSLQRALAVRTYLMERGVPNTRMDVRAMGNRGDAKDPPDRVDIVMVDH